MKQLLFAAVLLLAAGGGAAENPPLRNLDFKMLGDDGKPKFWVQKGAPATVSCRDGAIAIRSEQAAGIKFLIQKPLEFQPGARYRLSYEVRSSEKTPCGVYLEYRNADDTLISIDAAFRPAAETWTARKIEFAMPAGFSGAYCVIANAGRGECVFRNFKFETLGITDAAALKRQAAVADCFPLFADSGKWNKRGVATGVAEFSDGVLAINPHCESGTVFLLKNIAPTPGVAYELHATIQQRSGVYGVYIEYTAASGARKSINSRLIPAPGVAPFDLKMPFSIPDGARKVIVVIAVGNSLETTEVRNLELKKSDLPPDPTVSAAWRGGRPEIRDGRAVLEIADGAQAEAEVMLNPGKFYRWSFEGTTIRSDGVTGFAYLEFSVRCDGKTVFTAPPDDLLAGRSNLKHIEFQAPLGKRSVLRMAVRGGDVALGAFKLESIHPAEAAPLKLTLRFPAYRDTVYADQNQPIAGVVELKKPAVAGEIELVELDGAKALIDRVETRGGEFVLPGSAKLAAGRYRLRLTPRDAAGEKLRGVERTVKKLAPQQPDFRYNAAERTFYCDGKPFHFHGIMHGYDPELAVLYRKYGVTTFMSYAGTPEVLLRELDRAQSYGFRIILNLMVDNFYREKRDFIDEWERYARFLLTPAVLKHPALVGYCSADEPAWCGFPLEKLTRVTELIHEIDPVRPVWINEAPRGSVEVNARIAAQSDAFGVDIYPIPYPNGHSGLTDKTITAVGAYTWRCRAAAGDSKPLWMVLQGFAWNDLNKKANPVYPSAAESRFMALDAMANGANAVIYYGVNSITDSAFYLDMLKTIGEVAALSRLWQAGNTLQLQAAPEMRIFAGKVGGERYIVALNPTARTQDSKLDLQGLYELPAGTPAQDPKFPAYTARVFASCPRYPGDFRPAVADDPRHEAAALRALQRKFAPRIPYAGRAAWIWYPGDAQMKVCSSRLTRVFTVNAPVKTARLFAAADDMAKLSVNGRELGAAGSWRMMADYDVGSLLKPGRNEIGADIASTGVPPSGFIAELRIEYADDRHETIVSDDSWQAWKPGVAACAAEVVAPYGGGAWGQKVAIRK